MSTRQQTASNLEQCYRSIESLIGKLSAKDWKVQSLCPEWDVRGVVGHLASVENMLIDWMPDDANTPLPFDRIAAFERTAEGWTDDELGAQTGEILAVRRAELAGLTDEQFDAPSATPVGPGSYQRFMDIRTFDFWVHERDITTPLGWSTDDGGPPAEAAVDEIERSIGYIVGKKIGLPDGMSIAFHLTGPVERDILVVVDGRAVAVDQLDAASVEVSADSLTFVQLACGRIDPQLAIDGGRISWTGDASWGETAARGLRFTF